MTSLDGYQEFFNFFPEVSSDKMISFGLSSLISVNPKRASLEWENIKNSLFNNKQMFIRGYGRDAKGTNLYFHLYKTVFANDQIKKDSTNNHNPTKCIQSWTKHSNYS